MLLGVVAAVVVSLVEGFGCDEMVLVQQRAGFVLHWVVFGAVIFKNSSVAVPFRFRALACDWGFFSDSCCRCIWIVNLP